MCCGGDLVRAQQELGLKSRDKARRGRMGVMLCEGNRTRKVMGMCSTEY
jgi:hypothetical protein